VLAAFLGLVALNFAAISFAELGFARRGWAMVAYSALALDPVFLLYFVTIYPFERRTRPERLMLGLVGATSLASLVLVWARPDHVILWYTPAGPWEPEHVLIIANLVVGYAASWVLAVRSALEAPTPILARRSSWLVAAVGVAVIPRFLLLPDDFKTSWVGVITGRHPHFTPGVWDANNWAIFGTALLLDFVWAALLFVGGLQAARRAGKPIPPEVRRALRLVALVLLFLVVARPIVWYLESFGHRNFVQTLFFGLRWLFFTATLVYGILAYEVLEFPRRSRLVVPLLGGMLGGTAALLVAIVAIGQANHDLGTVLLLSIPIGLVSGLLCGLLLRSLIDSLERGGRSIEHVERRLELYRAALEVAWTRGPPSPEARRQLERDRRSFEVTADEARTLEHVVATSLEGQRPRLQPGDEPVAGLLLEGVLGEGSQGRVFAARQFPDDRRVVVKELHADRLGPNALRQSLLLELRTVQRLQHPNVVRLLDVKVHRGHHLLIMDYVEGEPLSALLQRGPLPVDRLVPILSGLLGGLHAAHSVGLVHRDVKPANVLVDREGQPHVTDFGLAVTAPDAAALRATITGLDALGGFAGTLAYMAPEQARGDPASPATDLYAAGLIAYQGLTGRPALDLRGCGFFEALQRAANPAISFDGVEPRWRAFLERALAPDPADRFPTADAMRQALPDARTRRGPRSGSTRPASAGTPS
jgi:tRNA A-37 threonylcarbamoyl transferase component Bud32